jgi:hypothetical protein
VTTVRLQRRNARREASEIIFKEWYGDDLKELRRYFFQEFVPIHRVKLNGKGMKDISKIVPSDMDRTRRFCYFFDKVGWFGAASLIDVGYVLGPMQHSMRRTWIVMKDLIEHERNTDRKMDGQYKRFDPVFMRGFEWLFKRSSQPGNDQASLLRDKFNNPKLLTKEEIEDLRKKIFEDEESYCSEIKEYLERTSPQYTDDVWNYL